MRALLLEDDDRLRAVVTRVLGRIGLAVDEASDLESADELLDLHEYDILVLDRRLPDGDGLTLCRRCRARGFSHSILMLTALDDARSMIEGLADGADDYLGKPFDLDVLEARVKALLRRNSRRPTTNLVVGNLSLDPWKRFVSIGEEPVSLTAREFVILETLMRAPGKVLSREEILEQAWGEREEPMSNTVDVLVGRLRRKIDSTSGVGIETVRGMGYRLRAK